MSRAIRPEKAGNSSFDRSAGSRIAGSRAVAHDIEATDDGLWRQRLQAVWISEAAVVEKLQPGGEVGGIGEGAFVVDPELACNQFGVFGPEAKGGDRSGVADHGLAQKVRELAQELMSEHEGQSIFARFR